MQRWTDFYAKGGSAKAALSVLWSIVRVPIGVLSLLIGIAGFILPIIPGIPFLIIGAVLLGPRTWIIRWTQVNFRMAVRRLASAEHPVIRRPGRYGWALLKEISRQARRAMAQYRAKNKRDTPLA